MLLFLVSSVAAVVFVGRDVVIYPPSPGWQDPLWIAAAAYVVAVSLLWLGLPGHHYDVGPEFSRALLGWACALTVVATAFGLLGLGEYKAWREYRDAPRCAATATASAGCVSEQVAVVESIRVATSTQYGATTERGQDLEVRLADGPKRTISLSYPPLVPYGPSCRGVQSDQSHSGYDIQRCRVPVRARLYDGRVAQLILPGGQKTGTDQQPGRYRLAAWLGALCLLVALWPLLPLGLALRRSRRTKGDSPMG